MMFVREQQLPLLLSLSLLSTVASALELRAASVTTTTASERYQHRSLIVGGGPAPRGKYDAIVWSGNRGGWGCGGAMIAPDVFLTAAHCRSAFEMEGGALVGAYQLLDEDMEDDNDDDDDDDNDDDDTRRWLKRDSTASATNATGTFYKYSHMKVHPKHKEPNNDIMLVKLKHANIQSFYDINRQRFFPKVGDSVGLVGFGLTEEDGDLSPVLKEVTVDVYGYDLCRKTFLDEMGFKLSDDLHLCTGTYEGGRDGCDSDSGTPLLVGNVIVGVTNDGVGCGRPNVPAYNARVSAFADWIDEKLCQMSDYPPAHCLEYPFKDEEQEKAACQKYHDEFDRNNKNNSVSFASFVVGLMLAFVAGAASAWIVSSNPTHRKRSAYQKILDDDEFSLVTERTEQASPALSTFSDKF
jgi:secreted trypsin-like serine protease